MTLLGVFLLLGQLRGLLGDAGLGEGVPGELETSLCTSWDFMFPLCFYPHGFLGGGFTSPSPPPLQLAEMDLLLVYFPCVPTCDIPRGWGTDVVPRTQLHGLGTCATLPWASVAVPLMLHDAAWCCCGFQAVVLQWFSSWLTCHGHGTSLLFSNKLSWSQPGSWWHSQDGDFWLLDCSQQESLGSLRGTSQALVCRGRAEEKEKKGTQKVQ